MLTMERFDDARKDAAGRGDAAAASRLLAALMDRIECGVACCRADGELLHANLAARRELAAAGANGLAIVEGRLQCCGTSRDAWRALLTNAAARLLTGLLTLGEGPERLTIAAMPMQLEGTDAPAVMIVLGRRSVCSALGLEMLASSHGLTYAESRVFRALVGNRTPREIAASHGVAVATVRTQIQAVRDKLGVRSIDALLLRAAEMPPLGARQ